MDLECGLRLCILYLLLKNVGLRCSGYFKMFNEVPHLETHTFCYPGESNPEGTYVLPEWLLWEWIYLDKPRGEG